ncbi:hypothetical protein GXW71_28145 [Roseomonas hellenica]|uniref:Rhamnogalacturonase A/B/Epimerase-like pectate lyase domain-containing protein n=1 Tax=Plastoroseomonas hellenica TaxID=2687306 RepID=A0ABS5F6S0_9PROT|nr:right-handed parallel beta-helix repeat-containing protein [Plastoroseomonas hellenica]MBR0668257.1 hypothetical protein [Plastoroseomonas hellenica]
MDISSDTAIASGSSTARSLALRFSDWLNVRDFGATGDGTTDDTIAVQNAEDAAALAGKSLFWPPGVYVVSAPISKKAVTWFGAGRAASVIAAKAGWVFANLTGMVTGSNLSNFRIERLGFDLSGGVFAPGTGLPGNVYWALGIYDSNHFEIRDCAFTGIKAQCIGASTISCNQFEIVGCYMSMPTPSGAFNQAITTSNANGPSNGFLIADNVLEGCAISLASSNGVVRGNRITGWRYGSGVTVNPVLLTNVTVTGNYIQGGAGLDDNGAYPGGIEYWGFYGVISDNVCIGCASDGISVASQSNIVSNNECINNGQEAAAAGVGIKLGSLDSTYNAGGCIVVGNRCTDAASEKTQRYGIAQVVLAGINQTSHLEIGPNQLDGNALGAMGPTTTDRLSFHGPQLVGSAASAPGAISNGSSFAQTVPLPGARLGDAVRLAYSGSLAGILLYGQVNNVNAVDVFYRNLTGAAQNIGSGTLNVWVEKPPGYSAY